MNCRPDLDWLRVIAFVLLISLPLGMAWSGWGWHINSPESLPWLTEAMRFTNRWRIPLISIVSGGAIVLALGQRPPGVFVRDRVRRLLLPLVFGILVIVPPQVYIERHASGQFAGSFLEWLPQAYVGIYPSGNLSWNHLWFVGYVLILTFVLLPIYLWARTPNGQAAQARLAEVMSATGLHWLMAVPLAASITFLSPISHNVNGFFRRLARHRDRGAAAALRRLRVRHAANAGDAQPPALGLARHRRGGLCRARPAWCSTQPRR